MLLVVFFLVDKYVTIDHDIVEEEKLSRFGSFSTYFGKDTFTNQDTTRDQKFLKKRCKKKE